MTQKLIKVDEGTHRRFSIMKYHLKQPNFSHALEYLMEYYKKNEGLT